MCEFNEYGFLDAINSVAIGRSRLSELANEKPITFECTRCGKPMIDRSQAVYVIIDGHGYAYCAECNRERLQVQEVLNHAVNNPRK